MPNLTVNGNSYFAYATASEADIFLFPEPNFISWSVLTLDQKSSLLISFARFIDSQSYIDSADQRSERELISAFSEANMLGSLLLATGSTAILGGNVAEAETKSLKAGSVSIENFRGTSFYSPSAYSNWPQNILLLLRPYLKSYNSSLGFGASSYGTCGPSPIEEFEILNG